MAKINVTAALVAIEEEVSVKEAVSKKRKSRKPDMSVVPRETLEEIALESQRNARKSKKERPAGNGNGNGHTVRQIPSVYTPEEKAAALAAKPKPASPRRPTTPDTALILTRFNSGQQLILIPLGAEITDRSGAFALDVSAEYLSRDERGGKRYKVEVKVRINHSIFGNAVRITGVKLENMRSGGTDTWAPINDESKATLMDVPRDGYKIGLTYITVKQENTKKD